MKTVVSSIFVDVDEEEYINLHSLYFSSLNSIVPKIQLDYSYYNAKIKSIYLQDEKNIISESEIEKLFKEIKNKKLYEFYCDYGFYLINKTKNNLNQKILELFTIGADKAYSIYNFALYRCTINFYDFYEIIENYDKIIFLLDCMLDCIIFENLLFDEFILLMGYLIKYSKFSKNIISKYLIYVKEINYYITQILKKKERQKLKEPIQEDEHCIFITKAYIYYFGFKGIEEQNTQKAVEYFNKDSDYNINITRNFQFFKYELIQLMNSYKLISNDELIKAKKEIYGSISENFSNEAITEITDYQFLAKDYFEGITKKKAFKIYESAQNELCISFVGCLIKHEIKQFLKSNEGKYEFKFKDEICCICYDKKVDKLFVPSMHFFCSACANKLENNSKCPICRSEIFKII